MSEKNSWPIKSQVESERNNDSIRIREWELGRSKNWVGNASRFEEKLSREMQVEITQVKINQVGTTQVELDKRCLPI